jgi:hypothetical protein
VVEDVHRADWHHLEKVNKWSWLKNGHDKKTRANLDFIFLLDFEIYLDALQVRMNNRASCW